MAAARLPKRQFDVSEMKALAHPLRQRLLYHLAFAGPATSTSVAAAFHVSRGLASYHLRQLARHGLVQESKERAKGRERWWRLVPLDMRGLKKADAVRSDARVHAEAVGQLGLERDRDLVRRYLANRQRFREWESATMFSSSAARLTKQEMARFTEDYVRLLKRYWRPPERQPKDARPIAVLFYAFPWPGE